MDALVDELMAALAKASEAERLEVLRRLTGYGGFCPECGGRQPEGRLCRCRDDE